MRSSRITRTRMSRSITSIAAAVATALAMIVAAPAANAVEAPNDTVHQVEISADERSNLEALLQASDNSGDVATFNVDEALALGADAAATQEYAATFVEAGGSLTPNQESSIAGIAQRAEPSAAALAACRGANGYTGMYWFGPQVAMNSCNTQALINGVTLAASGGGTYAAASALTVAGLPAAAVVGVVAGVLGLGVAFLNICKDSSNVKAIYLNGGVSGVVPPSCWAQ